MVLFYYICVDKLLCIVIEYYLKEGVVMFINNEAEYWNEKYNEDERQRTFKLDDPLDETGIALLKPRLTKEGNEWCFIIGENIQEGLCGFGETVREAMDNFNTNFNLETIPRKTIKNYIRK